MSSCQDALFPVCGKCHERPHKCKCTPQADAAAKIVNAPPMPPKFTYKEAEIVVWLDSLDDGEQVRVVKTTSGALALHAKAKNQLYWIKP